MKSLWLAPVMLQCVAVASAHVNDRGMDYRGYKDQYGQLCCGVQDFRPATEFVETIVNGESVVQLLIDGIWISVPHFFVIPSLSSDGRAHFCGKLHIPGRNPAEVKPEPYCVILPPRDT